MSLALRAATIDDIEAVLALSVAAAEPTSTDTTEALTGLLRRDLGALLLAEEDGGIVGSVIAGWDGWRGSIYRLWLSVLTIGVAAGPVSPAGSRGSSGWSRCHPAARDRGRDE